MTDLRWALAALVIVGAVPLLVASYQFLLIGLHFRRVHYDRCAPVFPRTAILIPAWNEAAVIASSVDRLMRLEYPPDRLRVFVIDDASTDETPAVARAKAAEYPGRVFHLRREVGGQGKAHTLNHGLAAVLADDWMQAVLIMDSDVIYEPDSLRLMARHLADPGVGSVTAYIKEGSRPGNYLTRFIGYEYITAQAAARRSQNVLGAMACLAGGAQLHSRANIEAIGGQIETGSLAEDTITTFKTQLRGARVIFEPHAVVWAEEPSAIAGLWKQRLRWARGNLQVSRMFARVWFRHNRGHRLGGVSFGLFWFTLLLQPVLMIGASAALVTLFFIDRSLAWNAFHALWITNVLTFVFITVLALLIDPGTGRRVWREAVFFPGVVSLVIMAAAIAPVPLRFVAYHGLSLIGATALRGYGAEIELFTYAWLAGSMAVAYLAKVAQVHLPRRVGAVTSGILVYLAGYGSLLCAVTFAAYIKELRRADASWDKTEKTGKVAISA
ncbi:MAG TPA: glycosyltransferase [Streptosporangiaceae bacterium]|nr:glycosyltransferase [Streptosporangiaceae bacterium]